MQHIISIARVLQIPKQHLLLVYSFTYILLTDRKNHSDIGIFPIEINIPLETNNFIIIALR